MNRTELEKLKDEIENIKQNNNIVIALIFVFILMVWPITVYILNNGILKF